MSNAWKSFHMAMYALVSDDTQRSRLMRAYKLHIGRLDQKDVPAEIREDFARLGRTITRLPARDGLCTIGSTLDSMSNEEVTQMVNSILRMYDAVTRYQPLLSPSIRNDEEDVRI